MTLDKISKIIIEVAKRYQEDRRNSIHVTDLTTCLRRSYYTKKLGVRLNEKLAFWLLFGALVHEVLTPEIAKELGGAYEVKKTIEYDDIVIHATADILTDDCVIELKTCNRLPEKPYSSHLEQLNFYMHAFDRPKGAIIYISRMQFQSRMFEYYGNYELLLSTFDKAKILKEHLDKNVPPPTNLSLNDRKIYCRDCPYKTECSSDSELL